MKAILGWLAALVVLAILVVAAALTIAGRDIAEPDVSDLKVERPLVADEANAYTYFAAATNHLYWPEKSTFVLDYLSGKDVDEAALAHIIARNTQTVALIRQGIEHPVCLPPAVTSFETLLPTVGPCLKMGKMLALKTRHDRLAGRYAEATEGAITTLRFGNALHAGAGCLIEYLVGLAVLDLGLTQACGLAQDAGEPSEELTRLAACLSQLEPFEVGLVQSIKAEHLVAAGLLVKFKEGKIDLADVASLGAGHRASWLTGKRIPGYFFQPNRTKQSFATLYRDAIAKAPLPYADMQLADEELRATMELPGWSLVTRPNAVGRLFYALIVPVFDSLLERKCRSEAGVAATRLVVALQLFRRDAGALPAALDELVPRHLASVPVDPYDGKPFRYAPDRGIVYSVGKDLQDSGGSSLATKPDGTKAPAEDRWKGEDFVFEIDPAPAQPEVPAPVP